MTTPDLLREHADYIDSYPDFIGSADAISRALRWGAEQAEQAEALRREREEMARVIGAMLRLHEAHHNHPVHASARTLLAKHKGA